MSLAYGFALPHWKVLSGGFSPAALFVGGQQGFFYDPSDLSTLFQDSAGTTPVTGVEQVVGLMLDKSKGLVLGSELVTNGTFDTNTTGWGAVGNATVEWNADDSGSAIVNVTGSGGGITDNQTITVVAGRTYVLSVRLRLGTFAGTLNWTLDGVNNSVLAPTAEYQTFTRHYVAADNDLNLIVTRATVATGTFYVSSISIRELPGNHATSTGAARPTLSARVNLLTKTEQFDDVVWTKRTGGSISATNSVIAPDNTLSADTWTQTASPSTTAVYQSASVVASVSYVHSVYVKKNVGTWVNLFSTDTGVNGFNAWFNLDTGAVGTTGTFGTGATFVSASMEPANNGFYKLSIAGIAGTATTIWACAIIVADNDNSSTRLANGSIYIWGADLRVANDGVGIPAYQRVNTATDYDSSGFPLYLSFGGTQAMSTGSIDFTATDKMSVFAGVRKLSDAAQAVLAELSADVGANNGSWRATAPDAGATKYSWVSKGTAIGQASDGASVAPITNVFTGIGDISGDSVILRLNGTQVGSSTADQGTGNFGNYPLYIGSRNLASLFLNGRIYSLIGVGSAVSAGNISATESWVNGKTKAY